MLSIRYFVAWEQRKLGEVGETYTGLSGKTKQDFGHGEAQFVTYMNVYTNTIANLHMVEQVEIDNHQNEVQYGDVFFTTSSETPEEVGMTSVWLGNSRFIYLNSFCFGFRPVYEIDSYYLAYMLRSASIRKKLTVLAQGISRYNISKKRVMDISVFLPSLEEQHKVGNFFKQLDSLIALHQRKLDKLKRVKSAYLTEMFPAEGEREPKRRFPGFTVAWEQRRLGEVADVRDGTHDSPKYINEGYPLLTSKNVGDGYINYDDVKYVSENDYVQINKRSKVDVNDILMGMIGTIGNLALIREEPDFAIKNVALIKHTSNFDYQFLFQELQTSAISKELLSGMDGGTQKFVSLKKIRNLSVMLPSENEQKKIGSYLMHFDSLIALHQRKLDKLKKMKAAYLEEMFV